MAAAAAESRDGEDEGGDLPAEEDGAEGTGVVGGEGRGKSGKALLRRAAEAAGEGAAAAVVATATSPGVAGPGRRGGVAAADGSAGGEGVVDSGGVVVEGEEEVQAGAGLIRKR